MYVQDSMVYMHMDVHFISSELNESVCTGFYLLLPKYKLFTEFSFYQQNYTASS